MAIGRYYTMEFTNVENVFVKVMIGDNTIEADTPEIIPLDPSGDPLRITTIDNSENKFSPLKGQQATITFLSTSEISSDTFADGPDDRFPVTIIYGTEIIFYGSLSLADISEDFLPPKNQVVLTANDKLGALKEIPLTDFDGVNPQGKYTLAQLVAMCLQKTGLNLPLRIINNLRHGTGAQAIQATFASPETFTILMDAANSEFFYPGQRVQVSGTVSNNITFDVLNAGVAIVGIVVASEDFTPEGPVIATFTDLSSADHFYKGTFLDAKTFEEEIGISENCEDVLNKILGYDCFVVQYKEAWWICRVDEYEGDTFYIARFDVNGEYIDSYIETVNLSKSIGFNETHWLSEEATKVSPSRPLGIAKLSFAYEYPLEIICNQSFERGDFIADLPDENNADGITEQVKSYELECWESLSKEGGGAPNTLAFYDQPQIAGADLYVKKFYYREDERRRELIIKAAPGTGAGVPYMKTAPIEVTIQDLINLSVNVSYSNIGSSSGYINTPVLVQLVANSGNIYFWQAYNVLSPDTKQIWLPVTTGVVPNWYLGAAIDEGQTQMSFESPPVPESGKIYIYLINQYGEEVTAHYEQPEISITPFVNGSYKLYKGHYNKVSRTETGYLAKLEDDVFIADSFGKTVKGAMLFLKDDYDLTSLWYDASKSALGPPTAITDIKPFGKHQIYAVWNQYRLANRIFQVNIQGFGNDLPSLVHKYIITDVSNPSANRSFLMVTADKDLFLCTMTGTIEQVYHTVEGKIYTDPHEFKYVN